MSGVRSADMTCGHSPEMERLQGELSSLEGRARELSACLRAMTLVGSSLDIHEVVDRAIVSAQEVMNAEAAAVLLLDDTTGELYFTQASGEAAGSVKEIRVPKGEGIAGWVAESGEPLVVNDTTNDPRFYRGADEHTGFVTRSILAVPLKVKDRIIGVAEAINKRDGEFGGTDLPLFQAYASLTAVAIENARMHNKLMEQEILAREIDIAKQIQRGLQGPSAATLGQLHFYGLSTPARSVGGDFFDWIDRGDGSAIAVIGDVSGKGVPAALLMANALSRLRAEAARLSEPAEILTTLNASLTANSQRGLFVTIFLACFTADGTMRYATAGHPLPLFASGGRFMPLPKLKGPPVAILPGVVYEQQTVKLEIGDLLVMFTDGVTEAQSPSGAFFGLQRLQEVTLAGRDIPNVLPLRIRLAAAQFEAGAEQTDDLTACAVAFGNREPELRLDFKCLSPDDLGEIRTALDEYLQRLLIDEKKRTKIVLAIDEASTNVIRHAYGGKGGPASLSFWLKGAELHLQIVDYGCGELPHYPPEDRMELKPGGLGLVILRDVMDEVRFETRREGGCVLKMKKRLDDGGEK